MTVKERFERKFADLSEKHGIAFLCRKERKAQNLQEIMIELSNEFFTEDEEINIAAEDYLINLPTGGGIGAYDDCNIKDAFVAGATYVKPIECKEKTNS